MPRAASISSLHFSYLSHFIDLRINPRHYQPLVLVNRSDHFLKKFQLIPTLGDAMATHAKQTIDGISVYVPTGEIDTQSKRLAPRLKTLRGARIGILDNCKEFADIVLHGVAEALQPGHGVAQIRFWRKSYLGIPSPYAQEMAAQCDAVINGVGH
jgi:hypothetical protein